MTSHAPQPQHHHPPDPDPDADNDGNADRAFLQALLARQTLTLPAAQQLIAHIETAAHPPRATAAADVRPADVDAYLARANAALSPFDFELRSADHQLSGERVWALVNTTSDALTQMATLHGADEIAFVKRVLDAMFVTANARQAEIMAVTGMQALRLAKPPGGSGGLRNGDEGNGTGATQTAAVAGLTMVQAEKVLLSMVAEGWFEKSDRGFYSLSPRALMELRSWLIETYNDPGEDEEVSDDDGDDEAGRHGKIKFCAACRNIVTVGQRCPDLACPARLHNDCVGKIFRAQGGREQCPNCETAWDDAPPVGELAAKGNADNRSISRRSANRTSITQDNAIDLVDDEADDGSDVSELSED